MQNLRFFLGKLIFIFLLLPFFLKAQEKQKRDSLYYKIEHFSNKRKYTKLLYNLIFRNVPDSVVTKKPQETALHQAYKGKKIRNIHIKTYNPLDNFSDTKKRENKWYENVGSRLHRNTRRFVIQGYLLFKEGEEFDEQKIYESERLLRTTGFINRVSIYPIDSTLANDSVDVAVKVLDAWSLKPIGSFSGTRFGIGAVEENFLGLGHEFEGRYNNDFKADKSMYRISYMANNIYGTYINSSIIAERDFERNENVIFRAQRDFYSPLTRWAGGVSANYYNRRFHLPISYNMHPSLFPIVRVKAQTQDIWGGYQFRLYNSGHSKVTENIVLSARFRNFIFMERPNHELDPYEYFNSYNSFIGSVGYTERKFKVLKNVFQYQLPEDIPYGKSFFLLGGFQNNFNRSFYPYLGFSSSYGKVGNFGYFNFKFQGGSFIQNNNFYRSTLRLDGLYFTPLQDWKFAQVRHFISPTLVLGNQRNGSLVDRIGLSGVNDFPVFNHLYLGEDKLILRYQLQFFINKPWKNFYINPYFTAALGTLGTDGNQLFKSHINTKFGIGVLLFNPYLAFNRVQLSFVFYPRLPFDGNTAFEFNRLKNYHFPINNFSVTAPDVAGYN